jgi:hypothetical protein
LFWWRLRFCWSAEALAARPNPLRTTMAVRRTCLMGHQSFA